MRLAMDLYLGPPKVTYISITSRRLTSANASNMHSLLGSLLNQHVVTN
jgi:hypothetical protein